MVFLRRGPAGVVVTLLLEAFAPQRVWGGGGVGRDRSGGGGRSGAEHSPQVDERSRSREAGVASSTPAKETAQKARGATAAAEASGAALSSCPMDRHDVDERNAFEELVATDHTLRSHPLKLARTHL